MNSNYFLDRLFCCHNFELKLENDVYWIPYTYSSEHNYSYEEMEEIAKLSLLEKKKSINTIGDAIMLFVLSDFFEKDDTVKVKKENIIWEYYKSGEQVVEANCGCCASCCSWANYFLADKFEETGIVGIIRPIGGHAINYFYRDSWYYMLDLQTLMPSYRELICPQTGLRSDFIKSKFITGILAKTKTLESYIHFYARYTQKIIPEHLFLKEKMLNCCPLGRNENLNYRHIYVPSGMKVEIIEQKEKLHVISYEFKGL